MKPGSVGSLGRRLSLWLAVQAVLGLSLLSLLVYWVIAAAVHARQDDGLAQKQAVVQHVFEEAGSSGNLGELRHKLDDFFVGNTDVSLGVQLPSMALFYGRDAPNPPQGKAQRVREFSLAVPAGVAGPVQARLTLNTAADSALLQRLAVTLLAATLLGAAVVSAGGFVLVRLGLRPLQQLELQARRLAASSVAQTLDGSAQPQELQPLIAQFNALLGRLGLAYEQLEGFNADVAHELLTPLTTMISSAELALRKPRDEAELRETLGTHLDELQRMSGVVNDMLFLSRADRGARARREPAASLAAAASAVLDYHAAALEDAGLSARMVGDADGAFDLPLLRRALSNLVSNATRYADKGSEVLLEIKAHTTTPRQVEIAVVNHGQTIDPMHLPRLFDRFYRSDPARSHGDQNHGLGLAIVAAVARMHGGTASVKSADRLTRVALHLPRQY